MFHKYLSCFGIKSIDAWVKSNISSYCIVGVSQSDESYILGKK